VSCDGSVLVLFGQVWFRFLFDLIGGDVLARTGAGVWAVVWRGFI